MIANHANNKVPRHKALKTASLDKLSSRKVRTQYICKQQINNVNDPRGLEPQRKSLVVHTFLATGVKMLFDFRNWLDTKKQPLVQKGSDLMQKTNFSLFTSLPVISAGFFQRGGKERTLIKSQFKSKLSFLKQHKEDSPPLIQSTCRFYENNY